MQISRIYDLKGSERNRFNVDAAANPHVSLIDRNAQNDTKKIRSIQTEFKLVWSQLGEAVGAARALAHMPHGSPSVSILQMLIDYLRVTTLETATCCKKACHLKASVSLLHNFATRTWDDQLNDNTLLEQIIAHLQPLVNVQVQPLMNVLWLVLWFMLPQRQTMSRPAFQGAEQVCSLPVPAIDDLQGNLNTV